MSEQTEFEARRTDVASAIAPWPAYGFSEAQKLRIKGALPERHALLSVSRRPGVPPRACGRTPLFGWRMALRIVATSDREFRTTRDAMHEHFTDRHSAEGAFFRNEDDTEPEFDDKTGTVTGLTVWTYWTKNKE